MKNDLVARYIYAVTKGLPAKTSSDIEMEIQTLIDDMLESRCGEITPTERDIRVVLAELGTPSELAEKYGPDKDKCLIGPPYYSRYKQVLIIVLAATVFGIAISGAVSVIAWRETALPFLEFFKWLGTMIVGLCFAFSIVTMFFAFFQYKGIAFEMGSDSVDMLPPVPEKRETISKVESSLGIVAAVFFTVVFLMIPQVICAIIDGETIIPVFNIPLLKSMWLATLTFSALGIVKECVKLHEGRYTKRLAMATVVTNLLTMVPAFILFGRNDIISEEFISAMASVFSQKNAEVTNLFANINWIILAILLFILIIDMGENIYKAYKYDK